MLTYLTVALSTLGLAHLVDEGFPQHVRIVSPVTDLGYCLVYI